MKTKIVRGSACWNESEEKVVLSSLARWIGSGLVSRTESSYKLQYTNWKNHDRATATKKKQK